MLLRFLAPVLVMLLIASGCSLVLGQSEVGSQPTPAPSLAPTIPPVVAALPPSPSATARPAPPVPPPPTPTPVPPTPTPTAVPAVPTAVRTEAQVTRVLSGDTIEVLIGGARSVVQYLSIQAADGANAAAALNRNRQLVEGKTVRLEPDATDRNTAGHLLRYVWDGDQLINATLLREGLARLYVVEGNVRYQGLLAHLEEEAKRGRLGIWGGGVAAAPATATIPPTPVVTATSAAPAIATVVATNTPAAIATQTAAPTVTPSPAATATTAATATSTPGVAAGTIFRVTGLRYGRSADYARLVVDVERLIPDLLAQYTVTQQGLMLTIMVERITGLAAPLSPRDDIVEHVEMHAAGENKVELRVTLKQSVRWQYYYERAPDRLVFDFSPNQ